ncbi:MAG: hypothetical protein WC916_03350 [Candidatus Woesearchaeota archaeon]
MNTALQDIIHELNSEKRLCLQFKKKITTPHGSQYNAFYNKAILAAYTLETYDDTQTYNYMVRHMKNDFRLYAQKRWKHISKKTLATDIAFIDKWYSEKFIIGIIYGVDMGIDEFFESTKKFLKFLSATAHAYNRIDTLEKITVYYKMAEFVKGRYKDDKLYRYLRRSCIADFAEIKNSSVKDTLTEVVDAEFLKYKK